MAEDNPFWRKADPDSWLRGVGKIGLRISGIGVRVFEHHWQSVQSGALQDMEIAQL
jgi:hypothetical protein